MRPPRRKPSPHLTSPASRVDEWRPLRWALLVVTCGLAACRSAPVPSPREELSPAESYQESQLEQLAEAHRERDVDRMRDLLARDRRGASADQEQRFATFERLFKAIDLEAHGLAGRGFTWPGRDGEAVPPDLAMDEELALAVVLRPREGYDLRIAARGPGGARTMLVVTTAVEDILVDGSRVASSLPWRYEPEQDLEIDAGRPFELAVPPLDPPGGDVQIRRVRLHGSFLLAGLQCGDAEVPLQRLDLEPIELVRFPRGFRSVRAAPLRVLRVALRQPADHLGHILVASWLLARDGTAADKEAATGELIELLRAGPAAAEKTGRACLLWIVGTAAPSHRDREGWLRWWTMRARGSPAISPPTKEGDR